MTTRHLVDPQLLGILDAFPEQALTADTLPQVRGEVAELRRKNPYEPPAGVLTTEHHIPGAEGDPAVRVLLTRPRDSGGAALPALLWVHGGGYVVGDAEQTRPLSDSLVQELGCAVVAVEHRLAPENPHPGPVHDCYAALRWMHREADGLGFDTGRIAVGGESAGGGLAAAVALLARDETEHPVRAQLLIYPMLDDRTVTEQDPNPCTGEFMWGRGDNAFAWTALLGHEPGRDGVSPYAAAARADDLAGLPPAFLSVGSLDLFLDENLRYAHRLMRAGVPAELHVHPGAFHGYLGLLETDVGRRSRQALGDALRAAFGAGTD